MGLERCEALDHINKLFYSEGDRDQEKGHVESVSITVTTLSRRDNRL